MPSPITGFGQTLGIKKASAWNVPAVCGTGNGLPFLSGQAGREAALSVAKSRGVSVANNATPGPIDCQAPYKFALRYEGFDVLLAHFMGIAGVPVQQGATIAYQNILKWSPDIYGLFVTAAKNMTTYIEEIPTAKIAGITLSGEVGSEPLELEVELIGSNKEVASVVNTLATFANVTNYGILPLPTMFSHLQFRMNDQSGLALAAGDVIYPSKFSLSAKRNLLGEYTGEYRTTGANPQDLRDEPSNNGLPDISLKLDFAKHTAATFLTALGNDTRKKMDIIATGPLIADTYYYQHKLQLPHLQLKNAKPTDDQGRLKEPLEFLVHAASAAPAGMTGITDPFWWTVINKRTGDPLQ
jgi:hypothetical protein